MLRGKILLYWIETINARGCCTHTAQTKYSHAQRVWAHTKALNVNMKFDSQVPIGPRICFQFCFHLILACAFALHFSLDTTFSLLHYFGSLLAIESTHPLFIACQSTSETVRLRNAFSTYWKWERYKRGRDNVRMNEGESERERGKPFNYL